MYFSLVIDSLNCANGTEWTIWLESKACVERYEKEKKNYEVKNSVGDPEEYHDVRTSAVGESLDDKNIVETDIVAKLQRTLSSKCYRASC